jgi:hypothetical protein
VGQKTYLWVKRIYTIHIKITVRGYGGGGVFSGNKKFPFFHDHLGVNVPGEQAKGPGFRKSQVGTETKGKPVKVCLAYLIKIARHDCSNTRANKIDRARGPDSSQTKNAYPPLSQIGYPIGP